MQMGTTSGFVRIRKARGRETLSRPLSTSEDREKPSPYYIRAWQGDSSCIVGAHPCGRPAVGLWLLNLTLIGCTLAVALRVKKGALCQEVILYFIQSAFYNHLSKNFKKLPCKAMKARLTHGSK